jgi:hypothetical protein
MDKTHYICPKCRRVIVTYEDEVSVACGEHEGHEKMIRVSGDPDWGRYASYVGGDDE